MSIICFFSVRPYSHTVFRPAYSIILRTTVSQNWRNLCLRRVQSDVVELNWTELANW